MNKKNIFFGVSLFFVFGIAFFDFISKYLVIKNIALNKKKVIFPFLNLFHTYNYGAAFGFLAAEWKWQFCFFLSISSIIIITLLFIMYHNPLEKKILNIAYVLITGGALGNLFDRICHGFVVDFIDFHICGWHFATFNISDSSITIGVLLVMLESLFIKIITMW